MLPSGRLHQGMHIEVNEHMPAACSSIGFKYQGCDANAPPLRSKMGPQSVPFLEHMSHDTVDGEQPLDRKV